jgi:hypothetical protein
VERPRKRLSGQSCKPNGNLPNGAGTTVREFPFGRDWNGRRYSSKQVRPVFVDEPAEIVVVTVYVYYVP